MIDKDKYFGALRGSALFPKFTGQQVAGINNLLDVWNQYFADNLPGDRLDINMATAYHETMGTMSPILEKGPKDYFNKYEPGTRLGKVLGNTQKGDGYLLRGAGHVQNTGRRNAIKASTALTEVLGYPVDFIANPNGRLNPLYSALSLFLGNEEGWWTGKEMGDYLDGLDESDDEDFKEFVRTRAVVNGSDKATKIAGHGIIFKHARLAATV